MGKKADRFKDRRERFVAEYLIDLNATQAAIRAGYSEKSAGAQAHDLLKRPDIQAAIAEGNKARQAAAGMDAASVLKELYRIASVDLAGAFDEEGNLKPIQEIPEDIRRAIAGIDVDEIFEGRGDGRQRVGFTRKVKFWDKNRALEMLGKHLVLFTEKVEHSGKVDLSIPFLRRRSNLESDDRSN